jgi:hypothetical protein
VDPDWVGLPELALAQDVDGSWEGSIRTTGLCLLALVEAKVGHEGRRLHLAVRRGLDYLVKAQDAEGCIGPDGDAYGHALATLALLQDRRVAKSAMFEEPTLRAIRYLANSGPRRDSSDYWSVLALRSAKRSGLEVDDAAFERAWERIDPDADHAFVPVSPEARAGAEFFCRIFVTGEDPRRSEVLQSLADRLAADPPDLSPGKLEPGKLFFGGQALCQMGGRTWDSWAEAVRGPLRELRRTRPLEGAWRRPDYAPGVLTQLQSDALFLLYIRLYFCGYSGFLMR